MPVALSSLSRLCFVRTLIVFATFEFDDNTLIGENVGFEVADASDFVINLDLAFQIGHEASRFKFNLHCFLVDRFQESVTEHVVNFKRRPNDLFGGVLVQQVHDVQPLHLSVFNPCLICG